MHVCRLERAEDARTVVWFTSRKLGNKSLLAALLLNGRGSTGRLNLICCVKKNFSAKTSLKTKQEEEALQSSKKGQKWDKIEVEMQKMY